MAKRRKTKAVYTISVVAEQFDVHPQTLRLYEREGLLEPSRTEGNTRMYTEEDVRQLEIILSLTRDLGVNIAGVGIILNMREKMEEMQRQMREFVAFVNENANLADQKPDEVISNALIPLKTRLPIKTPPKQAGKKSVSRASRESGARTESDG